MKKFRLELPDQHEKEKSILISLANICGIEKQPQNPEIYTKTLIDTLPEIQRLTTPEQEEIEEITQDIDREIEGIEIVEQSVAKKLEQIIQSTIQKLKRLRK